MKLAPEKRHAAKNGFVFPSLYGSHYESIARNLGLSERKVEKAQNNLWKEFPGIKEWQEDLRKFYNKYSYVETLTGRRRHAPLEFTKIINSPIHNIR